MTTPGTNGAILGNSDEHRRICLKAASPTSSGSCVSTRPGDSAQVMGALHEVNVGYDGALPASGHPGDAWGWVCGVVE